MPADTDANRLAWPEPTSRTVEVEQFCSWSACRMKSRSSALTSAGSGDVRLGREAERHPEEVLDQALGVVRVEERLADALLVGVRRDGRQLGQQPDGRQLDLLVVERVEAVLVEGRQRADRAGQHRHRVRVAREPVEEVPQVLVQQRVPADLVGERLQLGRRRQLAVDQQVADLEEGRPLGQLVDRVAAVAQDARVAVDVGDRRPAGRGVDEPDVQGDQVGRAQQLGDIDGVVAFGGRDPRQGPGRCRRSAAWPRSEPWLVRRSCGGLPRAGRSCDGYRLVIRRYPPVTSSGEPVSPLVAGAVIVGQ